MFNPEREDIQIICKHSNWSKDEVSKTLNEKVYNNAPAWRKFLHILLITLGIAFTVAGIIFFFAYNWQNLHKYAKFGIVEAVIIAITLAVLLSKFPLMVKNVLLTGAAITVGAMFAVFGQVYHTGANAYDFFLAWTVFITLWAVVSNFPPLWLLYLVLLNTTIFLYGEQVAPWSDDVTLLLAFIVNLVCLLLFMVIPTNSSIIVPKWFRNILVLWTAGVATTAMCNTIFDYQAGEGTVFLVPLTVAVYVAGIIYGLKNKSGFYLGTIAFSVIIIITALLLKYSIGAGMLLFIFFFIVGSVTLVIRQLIQLQKTIRHEN